MKSAQITGPNEPLKSIETDTPSPTGEQVLLRVDSVGVCHSDLHLWEGGYDLGDGKFMKVTDRGVKYPVTPGHEIAGTIEEIGDNTSGFAKGDRVLAYPWIGCTDCPACRAGNENLCDTPRSMGIFQDGGYADHVIIPSHKYLARLGSVSAEAATSLACSGLTAYTAIKKAGANSPEYLVIIGAGGLGLMGVQIAKAITDAKIICVDLDDAKLQTASDLGADYTINSKNADATAKIMEICSQKGADSVVDFVNAAAHCKDGLCSTAQEGKHGTGGPLWRVD